MNTNEKVAQKVSWTHVCDFKDDESPIVARVMRSDHYPRPRYSIEICRAAPDFEETGRTARHLGVFVDISNGEVKPKTDMTEDVCGVLQEAEEWVLEQYKIREVEILEDKIAREKAQLERAKPQMRPGLKTLVKRDVAMKIATSKLVAEDEEAS